MLLHPGGYRLTTQVMQQQRPNKDGMLTREIVAMVRKRAIVDPLIRPKPKIKFLVETDGAGNVLGRPPPAPFRTARLAHVASGRPDHKIRTFSPRKRGDESLISTFGQWSVVRAVAIAWTSRE